MSNVLDDLTTRFKSFSDTVAGGFDKSFTSIAEGFDKLAVKARPDAKLPAHPAVVYRARGTLNTAESEAARQRAALILQNLSAAYYEQSTDPVEYELRQMGDETKQDDIDNAVDRLAAAVEVSAPYFLWHCGHSRVLQGASAASAAWTVFVNASSLPTPAQAQVVSVRLARHVLKNQDKLIAGITNVTEVEDDLKVCTVGSKWLREHTSISHVVALLPLVCQLQSWCLVL